MALRLSALSEQRSGARCGKGGASAGAAGDELLLEALDKFETNYVVARRGTVIDDVAGREKLFLAINILGKVRDHLASVVANGKLAQAGWIDKAVSRGMDVGAAGFC